MSGFDENPFGEPNTNEPIDNPFADLSVQQATQNSTNIRIDNYDPFSSNSRQQPIAYNNQSGSNEPAAVMNASPTQPPAYTKSGAQQPQQHTSLNMAAPEGISADLHDFERRKAELDRKQEELDRREAVLRQNNVRRNNWPPLPEQCCFQPCFYQDINVDIQPEFQRVVRHLYYLWIFHSSMMLLNVMGGIAIGDFNVIGVGILYMLLFTPFSYLCWFRPAYKAFQFDSSFNFMVFFFVFFFQFIITVVHAVGIPGSATVGIITAIRQFDSTATGILCGIFLMVIALGFSSAAAADMFLLSKIHRIYRSSGASMAKAQAEFTSEFLSNQHVRNAASNVAAAAVQSQFSSATSGSSGGGTGSAGGGGGSGQTSANRY